MRIFVREHYLHTNYESMINATASGNVGQEVVRSGHGTITWVPNDRRIVVPQTASLLQARLGVGFPAWNPLKDMATKYHHNKVPQQIQRMLSAQGDSVASQATTSQQLFQ